MNETQIAAYLSTHPEFFERHAEWLSEVQLESPHGAGVISLHERQIALLRDKNRQLERRIAMLLRYGHENDAMADKLVQLTARLFAECDPYLAPHTVLAGLCEIFDVSHAALCLWDTVESAALADFTSRVHPNLRPYAHQLLRPVCGAAADIEAIQWLAEEDRWMPTHEESTGAPRSAALFALRRPVCNASAEGAETTPAFGLIVLGSSDPVRFDADMATDFLMRVSVLSSAALAHLLKAVASNPSSSVERASP